MIVLMMVMLIIVGQSGGNYFTNKGGDSNYLCLPIKVITKLPNSEQSYKGKVQTHNYINRQNQSTTGKL